MSLLGTFYSGIIRCKAELLATAIVAGEQVANDVLATDLGLLAADLSATRLCNANRLTNHSANGRANRAMITTRSQHTRRHQNKTVHRTSVKTGIKQRRASKLALVNRTFGDVSTGQQNFLPKRCVV